MESVVSKQDHPVFCLRNQHSPYTIEECNATDRSKLLERLHCLSKITWKEIQHTHKHGFGSEKIMRDSINVGLPPFITPDVDFLLAFRFAGKTKVFLVHRNQFIAHIILVDSKGKTYDN